MVVVAESKTQKKEKSGVKWFWLRGGWLNVSFNLGCGFVADSRQTNRNWQAHTLGDLIIFK